MPEVLTFKLAWDSSYNLANYELNPNETVEEFVNRLRPFIIERFRRAIVNPEFVLIGQDNLWPLPPEAGQALCDWDQTKLIDVIGNKRNFYVRNKNVVYRQVIEIVKERCSLRDIYKTCCLCQREGYVCKRYNECDHELCINCYYLFSDKCTRCDLSQEVYNLDSC